MAADKASREISELIDRINNKNGKPIDDEKLPFDFVCPAIGMEFCLQALEQNERELKKVKIEVSELRKSIGPYLKFCEETIQGIPAGRRK